MQSPALDQRLIAELEALVGPGCVLTAVDDMEPFTHDETEDLRYHPAVVVRARETAQVSAVLSFATKHHLPVTPRGGGTGLSGGALPVAGGILLALDRMDRILEIDVQNRVAVVQPGVITVNLQQAVTEKGLFYPVDPASRESCTIGGNVAENAGGPRALKYGTTKDYVLSVEAVLMSGEVIRTGGRLLKDVAGYNLTGLLVGSEGTLAVVTEVTLRLLPAPAAARTMLVPFPTVEAAAKAVPAIIATGIVPRCLEFLEREALELALHHLGRELPGATGEAFLLIELDGPDMELLRAQADRVGEVCLESGADDCLMPDSAARMEELWAIRRAAGEAVKKSSVYKEEDTVVPPSRLPELVHGVKRICGEHGVTAVAYGHAGDGNIHMNLLKRGLADDAWERELPTVIRKIFELTVELGGSITGEHGVGFTQRPYLPIVRSPATIALYRRLKQAFDPEGLLNPDKVLP